MAILYFSDILRKVDIDPAKVKLIRHSLNDAGFEDCLCSGKDGDEGGLSPVEEKDAA